MVYLLNFICNLMSHCNHKVKRKPTIVHTEKGVTQNMKLVHHDYNFAETFVYEFICVCVCTCVCLSAYILVCVCVHFRL